MANGVKYKDLPGMDCLMKLMQISFSDPGKNLAMYRLYTELREHIVFCSNEKDKLLRRYGEEMPPDSGTFRLRGENIAAYRTALGRALDIEVAAEIHDPGFTAEDFSAENCAYPPDKGSWPSAFEIATLLEFCGNLKKEKEQ